MKLADLETSRSITFKTIVPRWEQPLQMQRSGLQTCQNGLSGDTSTHLWAVSAHLRRQGIKNSLLQRIHCRSTCTAMLLQSSYYTENEVSYSRLCFLCYIVEQCLGC